MIPQKTIEDLLHKHSILEKDLSSVDIDKKKFAEKSKEYSDLNEVIEEAKSYISFEKNKLELEKILLDQTTDKELKKMAEIELNDLRSNHEKNEKKLKLFLIPKDEADKKNAIIEIRAGTGGLEASLFAADLFKMYEKVCSKKKWRIEIINISKSNFIFMLRFLILLTYNYSRRNVSYSDCTISSINGLTPWATSPKDVYS